MIRIDSININYGDKCIFSNTSLELSKGLFYCFIGRNGSGKTSLFKYIKNNKYKNLKIRILQQNQNIESTFAISIWDFLKSFCIFEHIVQWENSINYYLKKFDLFDKRFQLIDSLSGGEKQRMFLSQILLGKSDLILLDESFSNLDIEHKIEYYCLFKDEAKTRNIPIILIEHDLRFALEFSTNILFCITDNKTIRSFVSESKDLNKMINQEYGIAITDDNKYKLLNSMS